LRVTNPYTDKNDLKQPARTDALAREFHGGGNFPFSARLRWPLFASCFSPSMGELGRKFRPLCVSSYTRLYRRNQGKTLYKGHFWGNKDLP
jgi:hypothetical protein